MAKKAGIDSDYAWLKTHLVGTGELKTRTRLVEKVAQRLTARIDEGRLPYTLGIFGGWGTGKTTLLAMLAERLEKSAKCKIVYFNSWKYAGFMEIVPSLIYKILQCGASSTPEGNDESARRVLLALGNKYSDQVGEWAQHKIGVNPVTLFKDIYEVSDTRVMPDVIRAYYTQVDKAQDELRDALGTVTPGKAPAKTVVVLIDELDRCDPDEAFNVIKQMRVLFGMRDLPVAFVICANPEPIGLAIKHRYGLESDTGDYEARRILEKFVDSYEDLSESTSLRPLLEIMWKKNSVPWIVESDEGSKRRRLEEDEVLNATAFDAITTAGPLFANIRVFHKSFEFVNGNATINRHLLWTHWFLEAANQIDPRFRRDIRLLAGTLQNIVTGAYKGLSGLTYEELDTGLMRFDTDKGNTLFAIFRSLLWEAAESALTVLSSSTITGDKERVRALGGLLADPAKMDAIALLSLLPFEGVASLQDMYKQQKKGALPNFDLASLGAQFGYVLSC